MPFARYFLFVGGVLLVLLFAADAYLPKLPASDIAISELPVIRIHTDRKWPARVVYDTSLPIVMPTQTPNAVLSVEGTAQARESFAQMQPSDAQQLRQSELNKPQAKPPLKHRAWKKHAAPRMLLAGQLCAS